MVNLFAIKDLYFLVVIALVAAMGYLPSRKLKQIVVECLVLAAYFLSRKKRGMMEKNLDKAFREELNDDQKRVILKGAFGEFWQDTLRWMPSSADTIAMRGVSLCNVEVLQQALGKGNGVILWESNGFGKRTLMKQVLHKNGIAVHQVHGMDNMAGFFIQDDSTSWVRRNWIEPFFNAREMKIVADVINLPRSSSLRFTKQLLDLLKRNAIVCISGDGKAGHKFVAADFLHHKEFFSTGMVSLAKLSGATILPIFCFQEKGGSIRLVFEPPVHIETGAEREQGLRDSILQFVELLEGYVRQYPEQYRNWHLLGELEPGPHRSHYKKQPES